MDDASAALLTVEQAEVRLRSAGITGPRAVDVLIDALRRHAGLSAEAPVEHTQLLDDLALHAAFDTVGAAWQRWFPGVYRSRFGQFFTPRPVARLMLARLGSVRGERVLDPTCGAGGLLREAVRGGGVPLGVELDSRLARLAEARLAAVGARADVRCGDAFSLEPTVADVVVANPPFSLRSEHGMSEERFVARLSDWVRPGGRAAVVLPWSLWRDRRGQASRDVLLERFRVDAVCALPEGIFRAHGGAGGRAVVVWLTHGRASAAHRVRYAEVVDPGWDVTSELLRPTASRELERLMHGEGWTPLEPGELWPSGTQLAVPSRALSELVSTTASKFRPTRDPDQVYSLVELADLDRATGELGLLRQREGREIPQHKLSLQPQDVLVSRLRPELGAVGVVAHDALTPLAGSTEWIALRGLRLPWFVAHALRTEAWRRSLGPTEGQVRPRVRQEQVLDSRVPWPGDARAERVDRVLQALHEQRRALLHHVRALEVALADWSAGETSLEALDTALQAADTLLESAVRPSE